MTMGGRRQDASDERPDGTGVPGALGTQGTTGDLDLERLRETISGQVRDLGPQVTTPIQVRDARVDPQGLIVCDVDVCWLVPLGRAPVPDVSVPAPTDGRVSLTPDGAVESALVAPPPIEVEQEVRAWAVALLANGAVRGVPPTATSYGPPARPTHEIHDEDGRQVLRRIGYSA
jgi:hypothetical protein